jgi:hypothetical protein
MTKTKRQVGKGVKRWLGYTRRSKVWCRYRQYTTLEQAITAHIDELMKANNPYMLTIERLLRTTTENKLELIERQLDSLVQKIRNEGRFRGSFNTCMGRKERASADETDDIDNKIKGYIKNYFVDIFAPFRPLMIPLSGGMTMALLKKGDHKIFLIGERHGFNFCREKGYTPLAEIIEEYLASRSKEEPVDFMLEMPHSTEDYGILEETRNVVKGYTNTLNPIYGKHLNTLTLIRIIVTHLLPPNIGNPNSRVHWLDPLNREPTQNCKVNDFTQPFFHCGESSFYRNKVDDYLTKTLNFTPKWSIKDGDKSFEFLKSTQEDKINFFKACYDALRESTFFKKCYENSRQVPWEIYRGVFIARVLSEDDSIDLFYKKVQRFFMDMYTCCRIMKTDAGWYKNIVIYAGDWHVQNYILILTKLGYTMHELPEPIKFNPKCNG